MSDHAKLSPSSAHRWMACPGSLLLESAFPNTSSSYAEEGNAAHAVAAHALNWGSLDAGKCVGMFYDPEKKVLVAGGFSEDAMVEITEQMATDVQVYVDAILSYAGSLRDGKWTPVHEVMVERRVDLSDDLAVPDQFGTADAIIVAGDELQVHDLKFGRGVQVRAERNEQLMLYMLGAYREVSLFADIKRVRGVIHQVRLSEKPDEWACSVEELLAFAEDARKAARKAIDILETQVYDLGELVPGNEQCKFCRAKSTCPKLQTVVQQSVGLDFEDLTKVKPEVVQAAVAQQTPDNLALQMSATTLVEIWLTGVRAETERRLLAGTPVGDFKLVRGRKGNRAWGQPPMEPDITGELVPGAGAEDLMKKTFRLKVDEMYAFKLLSPAQIEKRLKPWIDDEGVKRDPVLGPRQWPKLQALVVQGEGKLSVAPGSDTRPAESIKVEFSPLANDEGDLG